MARKKGLHFYQKKKKLNRSVLRECATVAFCMAVAVFLAFVIIYCIGIKTSVIGDSMSPTLTNGQEILINQLVYTVSSPKRGDVIVFLPNGNQNAHYYVKRVVGLPGETVQIRNGQVYIDGERYHGMEYDKISDAGIAEYPVTLEKNEYFVLGDNVNSSEDSRSANIGVVHGDDIIGKAWFHMKGANEGMGFIE
ncbi:MAG: signal peptidase I [Lachnospiraceae bacterium]|nr:signal peptidase I [Lachnospiraceae bacterium]MBD5481059.1 signal peptidase I [Lachnospiraceae bacterium]